MLRVASRHADCWASFSLLPTTTSPLLCSMPAFLNPASTSGIKRKSDADARDSPTAKRQAVAGSLGSSSNARPGISVSHWSVQWCVELQLVSLF